MGTLLAINAIQKYPTKIKQLFLLAVPLKIFLKPVAMVTSLKVVFDDVSDDDPVAVSMRDGYSISLEKNLLLYLSWVPRYLELFKESKLTRSRAKAVAVPCNVYFSKTDDMVSVNSSKYFADNSNVKMTILEESLHLYFTDEEMQFLLDEFDAVCSRVKNQK
jgi:esterase/lipase